MKQLPWMALEDMKGDPDLLKKIEDAEALLRSLRQNLSKEK
jgi:ParB family chromosome partitioning protein